MLALDNSRTRRAYRLDVRDFTAFAGVERSEEMRQVIRAHLIAWRKELKRRGFALVFLEKLQPFLPFGPTLWDQRPISTPRKACYE